jgi:hypothetical protein
MIEMKLEDKQIKSWIKTMSGLMPKPMVMVCIYDIEQPIKPRYGSLDSRLQKSNRKLSLADTPA